ncbi:MAG: AbrB family transcriptional regulator [Synechococcaceae cyanobacterium]|nr:AbrB family transcriptional regulator [Synechococcaceae cyanobacterium]
MLTGAELLAKVKELEDASKSELVRAAGYVSARKDGGERLNFTAFYEALLEAKGMEFGQRTAGRAKGRPGRDLSFQTRVQFNGNLMVGRAYTEQLGLRPGDQFQIRLGRRQIQLVPQDAADDEA